MYVSGVGCWCKRYCYILSNGKNMKTSILRRKKKKSLIKMNRRISRRWGLANSAFRDYNKEIREENKVMMMLKIRRTKN